VAETLPDEETHTDAPSGLSGKNALIGALRQKLGDKQGARDPLLKARASLEAQIAKAPTMPGPYCQYGFVLAFLGEKEAAMTAIKRGMTLDSEAKDAFGGPDVTEAAAQVYSIIGEKDRAFSLLDHLLSVPSSVTVFNLKLNPLWDPLRDDPRFQALIDKYSKKA
jgi:hypothetical protein